MEKGIEDEGRMQEMYCVSVLQCGTLGTGGE